MSSKLRTDQAVLQDALTTITQAHTLLQQLTNRINQDLEYRRHPVSYLLTRIRTIAINSRNSLSAAHHQLTEQALAEQTPRDNLHETA